jgi:hypothetical protein
MARLQAGFLCNAASVEGTGLVSVLGAFIDTVLGPQLPIRQQLWVVARFETEPADLDQVHTVSIVVEHSDGEQLARIEGTTRLGAPPSGAADPDLPMGFQIALPLLVEFRREGLYSVKLRLNGDEVLRRPMKVRALLPSM